jgi:hypothetical protein
MLITHQELTKFIEEINNVFYNRTENIDIAKCLGRCLGKLRGIRDELEIIEKLNNNNYSINLKNK